MITVLLSSAATKRAVSMACLAAVMLLAGIATSGAAQITNARRLYR